MKTIHLSRRALIMIPVSIIAVVGFAIYFIFFAQGSRASVESIDVTAGVTPEFVDPGQDITYTAVFSTADQKFIDGADINIQYPSDRLTFKSYSVVNNYLDSVFMENLTTPGTFHVTLGTLKQAANRKSSFTLEIKFTTKIIGQATIDLKTDTLFTGIAANATTPVGLGVLTEVMTPFRVNASVATGTPAISQTPTPVVSQILTPTSTPDISQSPIPTITPATPSVTIDPCARQPVGDANCDGVVDLVDRDIWLREYVESSTATSADFNKRKDCTNRFGAAKSVCLYDLQIWATTFRNGG